MKTLAAILLFSACASAQDLSFYIDNSGSLTPLPSTYTFPNTVAGTASGVDLRIVNSSPNTIQIAAVGVYTASGSLVTNTNFAITGLPNELVLSPQGTASSDFTVSFAPSAAGQVSGFLTVAYTEGQNGCTLGSADPATQCTVATVSQFQATATAPQLVLTYDNGTPATPGTTITTNAPVYFGNVAVGSSSSITFTLANQAANTVSVPAISLQTAQFATSPFSIETSSVPSSLAGSASATFTVTFAPQPTAAGTAVTETATLVVGSSTYSLQGAALPAPGTPVGSDGLQVKCADLTGAPCEGTGTTLAMGPDPTSLTLTFTVINPNPAGTAFAALTAQPQLSSTASFTMQNAALAPYASGVTGATSTFAPGTSITIQPGWALTFKVTFSPAQAASATATLSIAPGITYTLVGTAPAPLNLTLMCGTSPCSGQTFTSQQQVEATLQWANSASASVPGPVNLTLAFKSAVSGITTDPAIQFIAPTHGATLNQISFTQDSPTGTFAQGGGSQFTFQTGTTAGTITITATGLDNQTQSWSFNILPEKVQITSASAVQQASNVVVTIDGYDNTYSAGQLSFTFYNTSGQAISPGAITVNASSDFHQYFFNNNQGGGVFALQATFPVNGDVTQIGSVTATITNSAGSTSVTQSF